MATLRSEFKTQPMNMVLIGLMILIYLGEMLIAGGTNIPVVVLFHFGATFNPAIQQGEWWRLLTAGFLHVSFTHILFNMVVMYFIGRLLEMTLGSWRYFSLFILAVIFGNLLGYGIGNMHIVSAGASGGIYGLFGAILVLGTLANWRGYWGQQAKTIGLLMVLSLVTAIFSSGIDLMAHIGGAIAGVLVTPLLVNTNAVRQRFRNATLLRYAGLGLYLLLSLLLFVFGNGRV